MFSFLSGKIGLYLAGILLVLLALDTAYVFKQRSDLSKMASTLTITQTTVKNQTETINQLRSAAQASETAINLRDQALAALKQKQTATAQKLNAAIQKNPDWAKQPLPAEILEGLGE